MPNRKNNIALELLWLGENSGSINDSKLEIFIIVRLIKKSIYELKEEINVVIKNIVSSLKADNYELEEVNFDDDYLKNKIAEINDSKVYAIVKKEVLSINQYIPYYYCGTLEGDFSSEMNNLIRAFTESKGASLSFQLIPTSLNTTEINTIHDYSTKLGLLAKGMNNGQFWIQDDIIIFLEKEMMEKWLLVLI